MLAHLHSSLNSSPLAELLLGRFHGFQAPCVASRPVLRMREYLSIPIRDHRVALSKLLLADHCLAEVRLRWADRYRGPVPRAWRLCRFCEWTVETPAHALLECAAHPPLLAARSVFLTLLTERAPFMRARAVDASAWLAYLVTVTDVLPLMGSFSY
ncbi:hypothetical protein FA95DRAFT_1557840 [Auriscalpium vulgare]|uniref:Uncharacterized protein n=1 Tax=Auriscalpium vulgare TaxID=40419 RepID=A0ACB8RXJ7_9AGAM|nr:hypothetical protein FA95DRAFT_1557840 [Auriscalpium vulgare]